MKLLVFVMAVTSLLSASCIKRKDNRSDGKSSDLNPSAAQVGVVIYNTVSDLPTCTGSLLGNVVFVRQEQKFFSCTAGTWSAVGVTGEKGEPGAVVTPVSDAWQSVWKKLVRAAVYIESRYENSSCIRHDSGTGFVVYKDVVATNGHVVGSSVSEPSCGTLTLKQVRVWYAQDNKGDTLHSSRGADGAVTNIDRTLNGVNDLSLLSVSTGDIEPMPLSVRDPLEDVAAETDGIKLGTAVLQIGYSGGTTFPHFATGHITAIQKSENKSGSGFLAPLVVAGLIAEGNLYYEYDLVSGSGASGGAVADLNGKVIAVNFAGNSKEADTEFGYGIPVKALRDLLGKARVWEPLPAQ